MEFAAELRDVGKTFPGLNSPVLREVSLNIPRNSVTAINGPNGSGKTTLLRVMALLEPVDQGSLRLLGEDAGTAGNKLRERVAMVFQQPIVFNRTVYDNIAFPLRLRKRNEQTIRRSVEELAKQLGLTEFLHRNATTLSGGQKQRVVLARTLAPQPELLLLDEPNSSLDRNGLTALRQILNAVRASGTVVIATPDIAYARTVADFFGVLEDGHLEFFGDGGRLDEYLERNHWRTLSASLGDVT